MPIPSRRRPARTSSAAIAGALVLAACAHVELFRADPASVCAGDPVRVVWAARRGSVRLDARPARPGAGAKPDAGSETFTLEETTRFELRVDGLWGDDRAEADVEVAPPRQTYGAIASCDAEAGELRSALELSGQIAPSFEVARVENVLDRPLLVEKDGRRASLAPGESGAALAGLAARGRWDLRSPLGASEGCDEALRSLRQRLRVGIHLACEP